MAGIVNGEVREIADIQFDKENQQALPFMLLIPYADSDTYVNIYYYNAKTNQTYLIVTTNLRDNDTVGSEDDFVVGLFTLGDITAQLPDNAPFKYAAGDQLALFAGDICCGVGTYDAETQMWIIKAYKLALNTTEGHFRYYSAEKRTIYHTSAILNFENIHRSIQTPYVLNF